MDAEQWLAAYRERLTEIGARAARAREELAGVEATASSRDGAVTVTVNPAGALRRLVLSERSEALTRTQLAAAVLATAAQAQGAAARQATAAVAPLIGEDSETMRLLRTHLPVDGSAP
ncbi:MAG: YbaB/EbfC family nucleoid-associated protein [Pseudonocardia sp.]